MARKVKCIDTQEYSTSDVAFKAPNGKYYSSEDGYLQWDINSKCRTKCIDKMYEIFRYDPHMKLPSYYYKKLRDWEWYGYDVIYDTIKNLDEQFEYANTNKNFQSEELKMRYVCAIIENNLNDTYKKKQRFIKVKERTDNNIIEFHPVNLKENRKKGRDVSSLLGDI